VLEGAGSQDMAMVMAHRNVIRVLSRLDWVQLQRGQMLEMDGGRSFTKISRSLGNKRLIIQNNRCNGQRSSRKKRKTEKVFRMRRRVPECERGGQWYGQASK